MKKSQLHGKRVTCKINGVGITDAKLSVNSYGDLFVCQNLKEGTDCEDKLGFKYSFFVSDRDDVRKYKNISDLFTCYVTDLKFVETRGRKKKTAVGMKILNKTDKVPEFSIDKIFEPSPENNYLELTQDNKEQVILILLEEGYKVWEKEGLLYFERMK